MARHSNNLITFSLPSVFVVLVSVYSAYAYFSNSCDLQGDITSTEFETDPTVVVQGCPGSYFKIEINEIDVQHEAGSTFWLKIEETIDDITELIAVVENVNSQDNLHVDGARLSSKSSKVRFQLNGTLPLEWAKPIHYQEINKTTTSDETSFGQQYTKIDPIEPNSEVRHTFYGKYEIQKFTLNWNFSSSNSLDSPSSPSTSFGFISLQNSNGRINLLATPSGTNVKFAIATTSATTPSDETESNLNCATTIDVITQNDPEDNGMYENEVRIYSNY